MGFVYLKEKMYFVLKYLFLMPLYHTGRECSQYMSYNTSGLNKTDFCLLNLKNGWYILTSTQKKYNWTKEQPKTCGI